MSLEPGGRAEKYGDEYENRYFANLLLRLVNEHLSYIIVEPIGENSDSVEFVAEDKTGIREFYQCKASNAAKAYWSISDLQRYAVFTRAKEILSSNEDAHYFFISPLSYNELDELCKRARTTSTVSDLMEFQLTNKKIRSTFIDCAKAFELDINDDKDQETLISLLSRCYFERYSDGVEVVRDLEERISLFFTGKASEVRVFLEQYANSVGKYGVSISAKDVVDHLESLGIHMRNMHYDERILPRIRTLNSLYWGSYHAINETLIHRDVTSEVIQQIEIGGSVVLHGKAGSGKSGCLQDTINQLNHDHVLYLSIKLDRVVPEISADEFGKKLGLPESPVCCLAALAGKNPCVLILDQLDALRWTAHHSAAALSVCKELISQAESLNEHTGASISIIFASRTFDLENDNGLKELFYNTSGNNTINWKRISIDCFTQSDVIKLIGDSYYRLSSRLQKLLLTPSSLYVWTRLKKHRKTNSVSSVYQLMTAWWQQILDSSVSAGLSREMIAACKNKIVQQMESNTVFSIPSFLFVDDKLALSLLVSNGMIRDDGESVSFVHQSFLDFFITSDYLSEIYRGISLVDLLDPYEKQVPQVRYRLVSVLQNLIEADQDLFVQQARAIVESKQIHYYFKCAVFETIGQCDAPIESVFSFVEKCATQQEWNPYIIQVVYYAHPAFVKHMANRGCDWLEDTNLSLLKSVSSKDPDFVAAVLRTFDINSIENARKIYWALCFDIANDSSNMFQFRMELTKMHPCLLDDFWGLSDLFAHNPSRAIQLLKIILENSGKHRYQKIYFGEESNLTPIIAKYHKSIVRELFPVICHETSGLTVSWPFSYNSSVKKAYNDWFSNDYEKSVLREIVDLVKKALAEYAASSPHEVCILIEKNLYSISAISHELVAHAISYLPESKSDFAFRWLLRNFNANVFVFTDSQEDYLQYAKQIIQRFSSSCTFDSFQMIERTICGWKDSSERMCSIYKHRIECNQSKQYYPVFWAFWGHMQKELLPCLDATRMSQYARELNVVLQRNPWVQIPHFYSGIKTSPAKPVISPVEGYVSRLSDKRWLSIIATPSDKMGKHFQDGEDSSSYVEADHSAFSSSLGRQAKQEPERFAQLSLSFPDNCYPGYIAGALYPLGEKNGSGTLVDIKLVHQVIRKFSSVSERDIVIAIARIIENRANEMWPSDILNLLETIATTHPDPEADAFSVTRNNDPENLSLSLLQINAINCVRGCAAHAIAAILWEHPLMGERFKAAISTLCLDKNPAVRFAAVSCLLPFFDIDREFSFAQLKKLLDSDLRIIGAHGFWNLMFQDFGENQSYYNKRLLAACQSNVEGLSEVAAGMLCALAIYCNDEFAFNTISTLNFTVEQQSKICKQAISSFDKNAFHEISEKILLIIIGKSKERIPSLGQLFYQGRILIQRDSEFLICLMKSNQCSDLLHSFIYYLNKTDDDICQFAEVLKIAAESLVKSPLDRHARLDVNDLVQCVIRLSDRGKQIASIRSICLEIWDNLFRSNLQDIQPLSDMIDNFD